MWEQQRTLLLVYYTYHTTMNCEGIISPLGYLNTLPNVQHISIREKSPTQGHTNPRKIRSKVAFGPLFPTASSFFMALNWFYAGNRLQETWPNPILRKHPSTGVQSNQDLMWCEKIAVYMGFCVHHGSWLLWANDPQHSQAVTNVVYTADLTLSEPPSRFNFE